MNFMKNMNDALNYIEDNIANDITPEDVANSACYSKFHFTKLFLALTNMTLGEYIRKRKLSLSVKDLISGKKVVDVALKYGYSTPESFSKAFKSLHGYSPSDVKLDNITLNAFPPLSFHITVKGDDKMDYKIVEKESFKIKGIIRNIGVKNKENFVEVPKFWQETIADGTCEKFVNSVSNGITIGACIMGPDYDYSDENSRFDYMIGVFYDKDTNLDLQRDDLKEVDIDKSTWAVFSVPLIKVQEAWINIFSQWFPATSYEHACLPELEVYPKGDVTDPNYKLEIWIPIVIN